MSGLDFKFVDSAIKRLLEGDETAREELIQLSYERLKKLTRKMMKDFPTVKRWEDTDDVFQRASLRLWKSLESVTPTDSRHYFNLAALQVRRELLELARSLKGPMGIDNNLDSVAGSIAGQAEIDNGLASETHNANRLTAWSDFHEEVANLNEEEFEVFSLIWYQGLSQDAVAKILNVSQKTVSRRWLKASRSLHEKLGRVLPE